MVGVQRKKGLGARKFVAATKSDTVAQAEGISRGIYIDGTQGIVKFTDAMDNDITLNNMQVGFEYDFAVKKVFNSVTTATNIYLLSRILMICLIHGAFDFTSQQHSGIEILAQRLRGVGFEVDTLNCNQHMEKQYDKVLGYSNGGDEVIEDVTYLKYPIRTMILLDPVWRSLWGRISRKPFIVPANVQQCTTWLRSSGSWPPRNSPPTRGAVISTALDHGDIPSDPLIHQAVIKIFQET